MSYMMRPSSHNFSYNFSIRYSNWFQCYKIKYSGLAHVRLSWSTVSGATGYEVYYHLSSNTPVSIGNTTDTTVNVTSGLHYGATNTFYVMSYVSDGNAVLPSGNSSTILTLSK